MPDVTTKKCPRCGQRTTNLQLEECPYCRVPLVAEGGAVSGELTQEQARVVARQMLGSWKLWAAVFVLVAAAAWGVVAISQKVIDSKSRDYLKALDDRANEKLSAASADISKQVSKQIESEFRQPRIQSAIEDAAADKVNDAMSNSLRPSLDEFQRSVISANWLFTKSSNELSKLEKDIKAAQQKVAQLQAQLAQTTVPATVSAAPAAPVASSNAPAASNSSAKLTMSSQTIAANGPDYILTVFFNKTPSQPIGPVTLVAATLRQSGAKIVAYGMVSQEPSQPVVLNDTKDAGQLSFTVTGGDSPIVAVEVTGPTIVQLSSDALAQDLMLPVAAEKLLGTAAAK